MDVRLSIAIAAGKAAGLASRALGRGGGTTLPGVIARRIAPAALRALSSRLPGGVVLVAGTNGKTTTTRMIATTLSDAGRRVLHNRAGANLVSGLTATALAGSSIAGRIAADLALFEVDEAAFPQALAETQPRLVVLHNLFRDQLDRYGEVDTIAAAWRVALEQLPETSTVLLNADDPSLAAIGEGLRACMRTYGLEDVRHASDSAAHVADAQFCRRCGARYIYEPRFYAHIGHYRCPNCGFGRPTPDFALTRLELLGERGAQLELRQPGQAEAITLHIGLPGLYNALNGLAAAAAALSLGVAVDSLQATLARFSAAFGRIEHVDAGGRPLLLALIKNPVGASETVRMLTDSQPSAPDGAGGLHVLIAINDRPADGTDVSWLWDADFERLAPFVAHATVAGVRAADMSVRLKYAGVPPERIITSSNLSMALDLALNELPGGATLYALPTYTAMLELRQVLVQRGWARPFWED
jgi:UDP-N-acetylmuramyl tripeptide synthase